MVLGLTACGEDPTKVDYNGFTYDQLKGACENAVNILQSMSESDKAGALASGDEVMVNLITRWEEATKDVGEYQKLGEFIIEKSGKTLTCEQRIIYAGRPVILTYVYKYHNMELEDITVDQVQTLGEKMTNAALNTLMGMGVVFTVLILISLIIRCFKFLSYFEKKGSKETAPVKEQTVAPVPPAVEEAMAAQDGLELAAVIAAAIAASTGTSTDDFVVRSIKRRF
ncbi:MAG: OadG family protein [Lachnospiraceae bacterium]|nr:OadG family protein [Lachnospiraceae bacterium]